MDEEQLLDINISFRFDSNGRTTFTSLSNVVTDEVNSHDSKSKNIKSLGAEDGDEEEGYEERNDNFASNSGSGVLTELDYRPKSVYTLQTKMLNTISSKKESDTYYNSNFLDDLLYDCEIADCALLPRTFWMPSTGMKPRCALEQCALEIFHHHINSTNNGQKYLYDPNTSGAEWWVQIRPSPPGGRYNILTTTLSSKKNGDDNHGENVDKEETSGICFHWDKDEDLRLLMGGDMYIHPHISTVTYLTDLGAPTMALNYRIDAFTGKYIIPSRNDSIKNRNDDNNGNSNEEAISEAYISWPICGKHLSFDGRYLHAAPYNLMKEGVFAKQITIPDMDNIDIDKRKKVERRHRRVTFLVNIWLNYKPLNVNTFPESMIDKLSKVKDSHIFFKNTADSESSESEEIPCDIFTYDDDLINQDLAKKFKWHMGGCESREAIIMDLPIQRVQQNMEGGNIKIVWKPTCSAQCGIEKIDDHNEELCTNNKSKKARLD